MPEVLWTICAILGVLVLAYLLTRYVAGRGQGGGPSRLGKRMLTILDQVAVGKDQRPVSYTHLTLPTNSLV